MEYKLNTKIFLVDDDPFSLQLYKQNLQNIGFNDVSIFQNGVECLNNMHQKPELIFLDHNMDVLNGLEVLKKIKRIDPNIFVVMLSAQENLKTAVDSLKYGAFDYIIKGDNEISKIERVIENYEMINQLMKKNKPNLIQKVLSIF